MKQNKYHLIFIVAGIAITFIVIGVAGGLLMTMENQLRENAEREVLTLTEQGAINMTEYLNLTDQVIDAFTVKSADFDDIQPVLISMKRSFGFHEVSFIDAGGQGHHADGTTFASAELYVEDLLATSGDIASGDLMQWALYRNEEGEAIYLISKSLMLDGKKNGYIAVEVSIPSLVHKGGFPLYENENSFVLFNTDSGLIATQALKGESQLPAGVDAERIQEAIAQNESEIFGDDIQGKNSYIGIVPIVEDSMYVCNIVPEESVRLEIASVRQAFEIVFGVILLCLLVVLLMSFFFYRKRTEELDNEMRTHLYGALSDSLDMAVNMYSPDDAVVTPIVAKSREIIGFPMVELISNRKIDSKIMLSEEGTRLLSRIQEGSIISLETGEFSLVDKRTGENRWIAYSVNPFFYENKHQLLIVFRDSTAEKNLQSSMKEAMIAAETANNAKSDFLSRMSHEIRTPMNGIVGMIQIVRNNLDDPEKIKEGLDKIVGASDHLLNIINDVLDISKIESGKMMLANEPFSLPELTEGVSQVIAPQCELKQQTFVVDTSGLCGDIFVGDRVRLQQVLINLLSNSVKYTPSGGTVSLKVTQECSTVRSYVPTVFVVKDNGIGMSEEYQKRLFEPFDMEERSKERGTGLGMPIVKNILTMMGGDIRIESVVNKGTTFTAMVNLELLGTEENTPNLSANDPVGNGGPFGETLSEDGDAGPVSDAEMDFSHIRVLLAEDNELNAEIAKELLQDAGLTVEWACDGKLVCEMFENSEINYYDIILMDIQMPERDGYEATHYIRGLKRSDAWAVPIAAMSANAFYEDVQASLRSGMNAHLSKPIDIRKVLETIGELIR